MADPDLPDNWGRWGADDELGTLNLITDDVRAQAAAEVRTGRWVSLAQPITPNPMISSPFAPTTVDVSPVQQLMSYTGVGVSADLMLVTNHHAKSTHLDALAHWSTGDQVYPGRPRAEVVTARRGHARVDVGLRRRDRDARGPARPGRRRTASLGIRGDVTRLRGSRAAPRRRSAPG